MYFYKENQKLHTLKIHMLLLCSSIIILTENKNITQRYVPILLIITKKMGFEEEILPGLPCQRGLIDWQRIFAAVSATSFSSMFENTGQF